VHCSAPQDGCRKTQSCLVNRRLFWALSTPLRPSPCLRYSCVPRALQNRCLKIFTGHQHSVERPPQVRTESPDGKHSVTAGSAGPHGVHLGHHHAENTVQGELSL